MFVSVYKLNELVIAANSEIVKYCVVFGVVILIIIVIQCQNTQHMRINSTFLSEVKPQPIFKQNPTAKHQICRKVCLNECAEYDDFYLLT